MQKYDDYIPIIVQTNKGDRPIENIYPGNRVYDFRNGKSINVSHVVEYPNKENVFKATYVDGRVGYYRQDELVPIGDNIMKFGNIIHGYNNMILDVPLLKQRLGVIKPTVIQYSEFRILNTVVPDSYIAGALLIYGNRKDKYINLPLDRPAINNHFAHKYQLDYGDKLESNTVYFRFNGNRGDKLITWKEFFPYYDLKKNIIPIQYRHASVNDRWQFIRGVFDTGFDINHFPNTCSIAAKNEESLKAVQKMLWSLGVTSTVTYDPNLPVARGREFRLDVYGSPENYYNFFYNAEFKETVLQYPPVELKIYIQSIELWGKAWSKALILDQPGQLYLMDNFLPRSSII